VATAVLFPGQGSQAVGMADGWTSHPAGKVVLDAASEALGRSIVEGCHDEDALKTTDFVQPALLACDVAAFRVLQASGLTDVVGVAVIPSASSPRWSPRTRSSCPTPYTSS